MQLRAPTFVFDFVCLASLSFSVDSAAKRANLKPLHKLYTCVKDSTFREDWIEMDAVVDVEH